MTRRTERVNDTIQVELSDLIKRRVKDPRICQFTSVTQVITSADLKHARIFISVMGSEEEKSETLKHLKSASGYLRTAMSKRLTMRYTPELIFEQDDSIERGAHLLELINQVCTEEDQTDGEQI
jgi:ribosome-binding factor A|tara:strand:- start:398 stop:769 length:372 start_codon:yes stop_codon:yes gene_type:complete